MATDGQDRVPLRAVVARPDLALRLLVEPPAGGDPGIRWTAVSELADPAPYLDGGELLLTAGVDLPVEAGGLDRYVAGLVRAGVSALGFGATPVYDAAPEGLVAGCRAHGLPLVEVARETPFAAVSQAIGAMLEERRREELRRFGEAHRALARAVAAAAPVQRTLRTLADALGCWAALATGDGITHTAERAERAERAATADTSTSGAAPARLAGEAAELAAKLRTPGGPRSAKTRIGGEEVFLHAVGEAPQRGWVLLVGRPAALGVTDRAVLGTAVALLGLLSRGGTGTAPRPSRVATRLLLDGRPPEGVAPAVAELAGGAHDASAVALRILRARWAGPGPAPEPDALGRALDTDLVDADGAGGADGGGSSGGSGPPGAVRAVVADRGDAGAHVEALDALRRQGWVAALSEPAGVAGLAAADRAAAALLTRAWAAGHPVVGDHHADPLDAAMDPELAPEAARRILGPLAEDTETARGLRATLRAWLARHGNWDRAAADLGAHRNSVRYRIGRIERTLGTDLADPEHRMRLWFALTRWTPPT